ncbi:hypothetical protein EZS27_005554 [termite gut metagenome]|uniref:Pyruvate phosphate dikinase AMP/ATP-binding domain-containing protein n=1 Tax=termite gut metagenome TaxID=433724 RepID=A0A5J4SNN6_9ZZZZ
MLSKLKFNQFYLKDTSFVNLMTRRIFNVLLIANPYDAFMLEDDGRIDETIFNEYTSLSLRYPPRFSQVSTEEEALALLKSMPFDLIICMPGAGDNDSFDIGRRIKAFYKQIPTIILTPFSHGITKRIENEDLSAFDYIFCWLGNTDLLVSIIKLIEDKMNLEHDVEVGVQFILLVEDGIRFYSSMLPSLYKFILVQSREFSTEALNEHQRTLRMRGRPKIVLARTYEEAMTLYDKYGNNVLGVITDVRFPCEGVKDAMAGIKLCTEIRKKDPFVPIIIQSSETENEIHASQFGASFINKNTKKPDVDLRHAVYEDFGFGDFIFLNPNTHKEIARVRNLKELQNILFAVPAESFLYHISRNHISRWLYSRAVFPVAEFLKPITWESLQDVDAHRHIIFESIVKYRKMKNQGVVAIFQRDRFDSYSNFARIGEGSLGGKGRGLAFIDTMVKRHPEFEGFENARVVIPKTLVLCTDIFDEFMESNELYQIALSENMDNDQILHYFLKAKLPDGLVNDFFAFMDVVKSPIAIRSSSLLEDSHYQPFAGIYSTYMIPYLDDKYEMLHMLSDAIKGVYASVYFRDSKAYMQATSNVIDQEKMAVVLQEVVGNQYGDRYYPSMSGVARSLNYYPIGEEKVEEGIVNLALGLGKYIVDGGLSLRFSPYHPNQVLQTSEMEIALKETQTFFYALDLKNVGQNFSIDDGFNLLKLRIKDAEKDGSLRYLASTYDPHDMIIRDGIYPGGRKVITFANVLQHDVFPLASILQMVLTYSWQEMRRPVEIEFAVTLDRNAEKTGTFYLLQVRPIVESKQVLNEDLKKIPDEKLILRSNNSLGHGIVDDIYDIVYVKTADYVASNNPAIAIEIEKWNRQFLDENKNYVLIGPGRWGSSDNWLGIPVKWSHISAARVIVEAGLTNYRVDPSQGTHFFQNLTSFGVGYFTINTYMNDGVYNQEILDRQSAIEETKYLRHVRFEKPVVAKMDGKKKQGVVMLPEV